jgi:hypothetical protein
MLEGLAAYSSGASRTADSVPAHARLHDSHTHPCAELRMLTGAPPHVQ